MYLYIYRRKQMRGGKGLLAHAPSRVNAGVSNSPALHWVATFFSRRGVSAFVLLLYHPSAES